MHGNRLKTYATRLPQRVEWLSHRYPYLGPVCWILTVQFFVAQVAAALAATSDYAWHADPISYLGIPECGMFNGDYVCSPLDTVFNASLIGLGVIVAVGAFHFYHQLNKNNGTRAGFSAMTMAALGALLVGAFPTTTHYLFHNIGTGMAFVGGLVGVFTLSISLRGLPLSLRYAMIGNGVVALAGLVLLALSFFLGMTFKPIAERMTSYAIVLSIITFGAWRLSHQLSGRTRWANSHTH